jgi:hypothetical protein
VAQVTSRNPAAPLKDSFSSLSSHLTEEELGKDVNLAKLPSFFNKLQGRKDAECDSEETKHQIPVYDPYLDPNLEQVNHEYGYSLNGYVRMLRNS